MTSLPHPVPSRLSHLTAELYGHDTDTLLAWQRTCDQVSDALRTQHGSDRLGKALALAQQRAVELEDDGFAVVTSGTTLYHVQTDGTCDCPDYAHRGAPCKHVLAVLIHTRAQTLLAPSATAEPSATPAPPPVPTSATWNVQEAPTSACFKWRVGQAELLYTFRGVSDEEVLDRVRTYLPLLQDILDACQTRADERAAARDAAVAQAQQTPQAPTLTPEALQALHALLVASPVASNGATTNGHANGHTPAQPPCCPAHGDMRESTKAPGTWFCTQKLPTGKYCPSKA